MSARVFWKDTLERALRTAAQAELALLVADGTGLLDTDWWAGLSAAGMAALLSLLTSLGSGVSNPDGTASLVSLTRGGHASPLPGAR